MLRLLVFLPIFAGLAFGIYETSGRAAVAIERVLSTRVETGLRALGFDWAEVEADGLQITLYGNAPDPDEQQLAYEASRSIARFGRVIDRTSATLAPPEHRDPVRLELHSDDSGLTLIGSLHGVEMRRSILDALATSLPDVAVDDLTGVDAARPPEGWGPELAVAIAAVKLVPRAFVRVEPGSVHVEGVASSIEDRERMRAELTRRAGPDVHLDLAIRVPARVIAPFLFAAEKDTGGAIHLESCAARSEDEAARIGEMLLAAAVTGKARQCPVGLGGPFGDWPAALEAGMKALSVLPAGRLEVSYRAVTLSATPPTRVETFESALAALTMGLPPGFTLTGDVAAGREAVRALRERESYWLRIGWDGRTAMLEGDVEDDLSERAIERVAAARFGEARVLSDLKTGKGAPPAGWQAAALAAVQALAEAHGSVELTSREMLVRAAVTDAPAARALHDRLVGAVPPSLRVRTELTVDLPREVAALPLSPERCVVALNEAARAREILFDLGSARIDESSRAGIGALAAILGRCPDARVEVGGHTDDRGREEVNDRLSRQRAEAVLDALADAGVARDRLGAAGYGEREPVASNDSEEGRAQNRRIAFKLMEEPDVQPR